MKPYRGAVDDKGALINNEIMVAVETLAVGRTKIFKKITFQIMLKFTRNTYKTIWCI